MNNVVWLPGMTLDQAKEKIFRAVCFECCGNSSKMAKMLNVTVKSVYNTCDRYKIKIGKKFEDGSKFPIIPESTWPSTFKSGDAHTSGAVHLGGEIPSSATLPRGKR